MFTKDKAMHSLNVANFMRNRAPLLGLDPDKAWLIGYIHDIGYVIDAKDHNELGAGIISEYSQELERYILFHDFSGVPTDHMEFLLRLADLTVDETGKYVGINERIKSILRRDCTATRDRLDKSVDNLAEYAVANGLWDIMECCY